MNITKAIHADTFFNALTNYKNIRRLANTCATYTIKRINIYVTNLPSWRDAVESWIAEFKKYMLFIKKRNLNWTPSLTLSKQNYLPVN